MTCFISRVALAFVLLLPDLHDGSAVAAEFAQDPVARFEWVRILRDAAELDAALVVVDSLRDDYPRDVDYRFARAQILARLQRNDEALEELAIATELAPEYEDVWRLRFSLLQANRAPNKVEQKAALSREAEERFPQSDWWKSSSYPLDNRWTVWLGGGRDSLSNGQSDWHSQFVGVQTKPNDKSLYEIRVDRDVRFSGGDNAIRLSTEHQWPDEWFSGAAIGYTSSPQFKPKTELDLHLGRPLSDGWVVDLRYRRRNYDAVRVDSVVGSVEKYVGNYRFAYGLGVSQLTGSGSSASHTLSGNWYYSEDSSLGLTLSTGEEAEAIGNQQVLKTEVRGVTVSGRYPFSQRINLNWWVGTHEQGDFYRRRYFGLAVSIRI